MDKLKLGGIGCILVLAGVVVGIVAGIIISSSMMQSGMAMMNVTSPEEFVANFAGPLQSALPIALAGTSIALLGTLLVVMGALGLNERFPSPLYLVGGVLVFVGAV